MNPTPFSTTTLDQHPSGEMVKRVLAAALAAVSPFEAVMNHLKLVDDVLVCDEQEVHLDSIEKIFVVGAGKATFPMTQAVFELLGERIAKGVIIVKDGHLNRNVSLGPIEVFEAAHPLPDQRGVDATLALLAVLDKVSEKDLVICLISGGGSALMTAPEDPITLDDMREMTDLLLGSGATINEINILRKHVDCVKGGGIAATVAPARLMTLILSDVVGDPLDAIASGPTVSDSSSFADVERIFERYSLDAFLPDSIVTHVLKGIAGEIDDTPKRGDAIFANSSVHLIGNLKIAANAAKMQAFEEGFNSNIASTSYQGEARNAGEMFVKVLKEMSEIGIPLRAPACLIFGGETTVTLRGKGKGGRNQEIALSAVRAMKKLKHCLLVTLATDGGDGPTDAAGAVVTPETMEKGIAAGLDVQEFLHDNDSYHYFETLGDLLKTGPTQTNVNDLAFLFCFE